MPTTVMGSARNARTLRKSTLLFFSACLVVILANKDFFRQLLEFSANHEFASHILFIPPASALLIFHGRRKIFVCPRGSTAMGVTLSLAASVALIVSSTRGSGIDATDMLTVRAFTIVVLWQSLFLAFYGTESFRNAPFPLLLLFLMVPFPESLVQAVVAILQRGSAEGVAMLFSLTGTLFHREGLKFDLPRVSIEIASQCSGIRSSFALLLSCLLAGHLLLRTQTRKLVLVLLAIPMAVLKNAVRIVTLSLLAIHMDMRFLGGSDLHQRGGIVFFMATLLLMAPMLWLLRRSEDMNSAAIAEKDNP